MPTRDPSRLREKRWAPHSLQKHFSAPSPAGSQPLISSSPCSQCSASGSMKAEIEDPVPVRRWQRVQWQ